MAETETDAMSRDISALFDYREEANRAVAALAEAGIANVGLTGDDNAGYSADNRDYAIDTRDHERGFFEAIGDFFFPDKDRYSFAEGLNLGAFLVTVRQVPADRYDEVLNILDDAGAVDMDARVAEWRSAGWAGHQRPSEESPADFSTFSADALVSSDDGPDTADGDGALGNRKNR
ncbi:hypothetical protein [Paracoccus pacificus]|uniref:Uncharacterized protein n=1 Tax=Paracoccus pacificus TaxID=1463598 RepID=A0ABW4R8M5_9RHOB